MVAWEEVKREVATGHDQPAFLSRVVTIDSPLRGISPLEMLLGNLLRRYPPIGARLDCVLRGQAANVLLGIARDRTALTSLQQVAAHATRSGISIMNVANVDDCVWSPGTCGVPLPRDPQTQWVGGAAVRTAIFTIPRPCLRPEAQCFIGTHGAVLTNTNGPQGLRAIAAFIGPQQPVLP
jgi:hypothetical protein